MPSPSNRDSLLFGGDGAQRSAKPPVDWKSIAGYHVLACGISWPFFWQAFVRGWQDWAPPQYFRTTTYMWGPGIAAVILMTLRARSHRRTIRLFGSSIGRSLLFYLAPMVVLILVHLPNLKENAVFTILFMVFVGFGNIMGEELGWRGYLQDAVRPLPSALRYFVIGVLWELWHFRFGIGLANDRSLGPILLFEVMITAMAIAFSAGIGEATDRSRSLIIAVTLHYWIDLLLEAPAMFGTSPHKTIAVAVVSAMFWLWMLWTWPQPTKG